MTALPSVMYVMLAGFVSIASLGEVAVASGMPWLVPSLGPTAFMLFATPRVAGARLDNVLCGHAIAIGCAWVALWGTGLIDAGPTDPATIGHARVVAAAFALAATAGLMLAVGKVHPPAGATTLIVALGFITRWQDLIVVELAVAVLCGEALVLNQIFGRGRENNSDHCETG